jgi:hypothetical protein
MTDDEGERFLKPGVTVEYAPDMAEGSRWYRGVVSNVPTRCGSTLCVCLRDMEPAYGDETHRPGRTTVNAAAVAHIRIRMVNVMEIIKTYLEENHYDGLVEHNCACSCTIDDLVPCGELRGRCEPGHRVPCACGEGCDFDIAPGPRGWRP